MGHHSTLSPLEIKRRGAPKLEQALAMASSIFISTITISTTLMYELIAPLLLQWNTYFSSSHLLQLSFELLWLSIALLKLVFACLCNKPSSSIAWACIACVYRIGRIFHRSFHTHLCGLWDWGRSVQCMLLCFCWRRSEYACVCVCVCVNLVVVLFCYSPTLGISTCAPLGWIPSSKRDANPIGVSLDCAPLYMLHA